ncbi:helix-turn-helix domain-containing protein [Streptomyces cinereoruber]|uniref:hypothetical protein n=1 Tax=Streptomyces cinereoruber TaxID=67260 RepID=UPI003643E915
MLIATREGDRRCCALVTLVLRKNDTLRQLAAGCGISLVTAHAHAVIDHLAELAPGLPRP